MPNLKVATYRQSCTTRYRTIRRISLRCEAGTHHVNTGRLKAASLLHGNKVSKPIEIEIQIQIEKELAGGGRCGVNIQEAQCSTVSVSVQS
jgi:hypothetical protein